MKNLIALIFALTIFATAVFAQNPTHVYVNGYTKNNGTYVQGYYRTAPNSTINDNFSTSPNVNPYTGKQGTITPTYNYTPDTYRSNSTTSPSYYNSTYTTPSYTPLYTYYTYRVW